MRKIVQVIKIVQNLNFLSFPLFWNVRPTYQKLYAELETNWQKWKKIMMLLCLRKTSQKTVKISGRNIFPSTGSHQEHNLRNNRFVNYIDIWMLPLYPPHIFIHFSFHSISLFSLKIKKKTPIPIFSNFLLLCCTIDF